MNRRRAFTFFGGSLFFIALFLLVLWLFVWRYDVYTEDAYVAGNLVSLNSQVKGYVAKINTDFTYLVNEMDLLVELDTTDFALEVEKKKELLSNRVREVAKLFESIKAHEAEVELKRAELALAQYDTEQRKGLSQLGAISEQESVTYKTSFEMASASLEWAEKRLDEAKALVLDSTIETHPLVREAAVAFKEAYINLLRCKIVAPTRGYVANRTVEVGDSVDPETPLLQIVPLDNVWLNANYKETQLQRVRIGQSATFTADMWGKEITFHGKVLGFNPGTGSAFSLLPPQNASGNWIKIVQRVPVRISIDPEELKEHPLLIGLSTRVHVHTEEIDLPLLAEERESKPYYSTCIYEREESALKEAEEIISHIISVSKKTSFSE